MIGLEDGLRYVLGLLAVLGLIFLAARAYRSLNERGLPGTAKRFRRLGVQEFLPLDARRRLVLLRHDEQEYLVLLGVQGETLLNVAPRGDAVDRAERLDAPRPVGPTQSGPVNRPVPATVLDLLRHLRGPRTPAARPPDGPGTATSAETATAAGAPADDTEETGNRPGRRHIGT